jgi:hypothetical protein
MSAPLSLVPDSCMLCDHWCDEGYHTACMLREVVGGIGHLLDHYRYCIQMGDPDAGLGYRRSALCVAALIARIDLVIVLDGNYEHPSLEDVMAWAALA